MSFSIKDIVATHAKKWAGEVQNNVLVHPDNAVASYIGRVWPDREANGNRIGLDIGFGSGRHLIALGMQGFQLCGIEISQETIDAARALLKQRNLSADLRLESIEQATFGEDSIDAIVYFGAAFLSPLANMRNCLSRIYRIMKPGGGMIVNFRNPESWTYGLGERIDGETFLLDKRAGPYAGAVYTFLPAESSRRLLEDCGFTVNNSERYEHYKNNQSERHSWTVYWISK